MEKTFKKDLSQLRLRFRAITPSGKYFNQNEQLLTSFLRRVLTLWEVSHPTYLKKDGKKIELEDLLQIKIGNRWIQTKF